MTDDPDLLYVAIFVFTMLLIGIALTVREFSSDHIRKQHSTPGE